MEAAHSTCRRVELCVLIPTHSLTYLVTTYSGRRSSLPWLMNAQPNLDPTPNPTLNPNPNQEFVTLVDECDLLSHREAIIRRVG